MRKGVTLIETMIVLVLAGIIMPFLFRMITITFDSVSAELNSRRLVKEDMSFVLEKEKQALIVINTEDSNIKYFVKKGKAINNLVIIGEEK
ncbi:MAG: prepilin-type N-terminal cleavage/methylation domain-containing protein [Candidatus Margulisbacteria bacterium]|nr:prepilin-type N-terminal cleavage/methylation domain-containing protein [Candidatus Margulisiibacteriota bacterium]